MNNDTLDNKSEMTLEPELRFYGIEDVFALTGWSVNTVQKLFNDPNFPSADYGKTKVIEASALKQFFSIRHEKAHEKFWEKDDLCR